MTCRSNFRGRQTFPRNIFGRKKKSIHEKESKKKHDLNCTMYAFFVCTHRHCITPSSKLATYKHTSARQYGISLYFTHRNISYV